MGKLSKKLVVYLDQNFISEMAKADIKQAVNPLFKNIYELLHQGFLDEKTVVPASWFHKIETSLDTRLKERITSYQNYLGQLEMNFPDFILTFQMVKAAKEFLGEPEEPMTYNFAYHDDPDERAKRFNINVDMHLERFFDYRSDRMLTADRLNKIRETVKQNGINFKAQRQLELDANTQNLLNSYDLNRVSWVFHKFPERVKDFAVSPQFLSIPRIEISSNFWAKILVDFNNREIKNSDPMDVDIISTFLPYVDVFATDTFMANQIKNFGYDTKFGTQVFDSSKKGLQDFEKFLTDYLPKHQPVNRPSASVFVIPDKQIRENSFEYFRKFGNQWLGKGRLGQWVDIYAFDDGLMPKYKHRASNIPLPFYGLQDVDAIKVEPDCPLEKLLETCRKLCKSDKFVVIDSYRELPENFKETLVDYVGAGKDLILGYKIYKTAG
jgi:hypothetical protein